MRNMVAKDSFRKDLESENILQKVVDEYILNPSGMRYERVTSIEEQHKGIDLRLWKDVTDTFPLLVDEKAALHHLRSPLPTFAFELSYHLKNTLRKGWLFDKHKATTAYFLLWPMANCDRLININQLESISATLVMRRSILRYLRENGLNESRCIELVHHLEGIEHSGRYDIGIKGVHAFRSSYYNERPVNLVIRREILDKISTMNFQGIHIE